MVRYAKATHFSAYCPSFSDLGLHNGLTGSLHAPRGATFFCDLYQLQSEQSARHVSNMQGLACSVHFVQPAPVCNWKGGNTVTEINYTDCQ